MTVEFFIDLKEGHGYRKPFETDETTEMTVSINAKSLAFAERQLKTLAKDGIIECYCVNCQDKEYEELRLENKDLQTRNNELSDTNIELYAEISRKDCRIEELETQLQQYKVCMFEIMSHTDRYSELLTGLKM